PAGFRAAAGLPAEPVALPPRILVGPRPAGHEPAAGCPAGPRRHHAPRFTPGTRPGILATHPHAGTGRRTAVNQVAPARALAIIAPCGRKCGPKRGANAEPAIHWAITRSGAGRHG